MSKYPYHERERLLDTKTAAKILGVHHNTLVKWRTKGGGPDFEVLGSRTIRYSPRALMRYRERRTFNNTANRGANPTTLYRKR